MTRLSCRIASTYKQGQVENTIPSLSREWKRFFSPSIRTLNNLPKNVVDSLSVSSFKTNLDKAWKDHPLKYEFIPSLHRLEYRGIRCLLLCITTMIIRRIKISIYCIKSHTSFWQPSLVNLDQTILFSYPIKNKNNNNINNNNTLPNTSIPKTKYELEIYILLGQIVRW